MIAAYVYDDYYCNGIRSSYRGLYQDEEEAKLMLRGDRHDKQNLELFDLITHAYSLYKWESLYELDGDNSLVLTHRLYKDTPKIAVEWHGDNQRYGEHNVYYDAGYWKREQY